MKRLLFLCVFVLIILATSMAFGWRADETRVFRDQLAPPGATTHSRQQGYREGDFFGVSGGSFYVCDDDTIDNAVWSILSSGATAFTFPTDKGTNTYVLTSDGAGGADWLASAGGGGGGSGVTWYGADNGIVGVSGQTYWWTGKGGIRTNIVTGTTVFIYPAGVTVFGSDGSIVSGASNIWIVNDDTGTSTTAVSDGKGGATVYIGGYSSGDSIYVTNINAVGGVTTPHLSATSGYIGALFAGGVTLPSVNIASSPTLAFGDGDSGFYESADDAITTAIGGTNMYLVDSNGLSSLQADSFYLQSGAGSGTDPVYNFTGGDSDTGMGRYGEDQPSLIAGAVEALRASKNGVTVFGVLDAESGVSVRGGITIWPTGGGNIELSGVTLAGVSIWAIKDINIINPDDQRSGTSTIIYVGEVDGIYANGVIIDQIIGRQMGTTVYACDIERWNDHSWINDIETNFSIAGGKTVISGAGIDSRLLDPGDLIMINLDTATETDQLVFHIKGRIR